MGKVAYRFVPCDENGRPRENSQYTSIRDVEERIQAGSTITANLLGFSEWEVVELRGPSGPLEGATDEQGAPIPVGGTLVCRGVRRD
jgi:hypothetical protein